MSWSEKYSLAFIHGLVHRQRAQLDFDGSIGMEHHTSRRYVHTRKPLCGDYMFTLLIRAQTASMNDSRTEKARQMNFNLLTSTYQW
jgi:hypothetical protein